MNTKSLLHSRLSWLIFSAALAFASGCAYLETKQGDWIFNPVQGAWRGYRGTPAGVEEVWIPVGTRGEKLHAWWSPQPDQDAPVLLYLHGARWNLTGSVTRIPRWHRMGFAVLAIDYRSFGKSAFADGSSPTEQSANEDAEAAWRYLVARSPGTRRFVFGHSLGGSMATHLALKEKDVHGLILEGTFTSVPDMIKETRWGFLPVDFLVTQRFDILHRIDGVSVPVLFAHGTEDSIVPFAMSERLFAAAKAPKRLLRAEGGSHHNLTVAYFDEYQRAVSEHFGLNTDRAAASAAPGTDATRGLGLDSAAKTDSATR